MSVARITTVKMDSKMAADKQTQARGRQPRRNAALYDRPPRIDSCACDRELARVCGLLAPLFARDTYLVMMEFHKASSMLVM